MSMCLGFPTAAFSEDYTMAQRATIRIIFRTRTAERPDQRSVWFALLATSRGDLPLNDARSTAQTARPQQACMAEERRSGGFRLELGDGPCSAAAFRYARDSPPSTR